MQLKLKNPELLQKFKKYVMELKKEDRIAVMHHTDPDGITSGVIISKIIERIRRKAIDLRHNQKGNEFDILPSTISLFKENKINKIVIIDVSVDHDTEGIKKLEEFADVLVIDHHKVYNNINSDKTTFLNPTLIYNGVDSSSYCASKFAFDLGEMIVDIKDIDWIAAIGLAGDCCVPYWREFFEEVLEKYGMEKKLNPFKTMIGKIAEMISFAESYDYNNSKLSYEVLCTSRYIGDVIESPIKKYYEEIKNEVNDYIDNFEDKSENYPELTLGFLEVKSAHSIKSNISTLLSLKYPETTLIIYQAEGENIQFSARRHDKALAVNDLCEEAVSDIVGGSAGGHSPAAGGKIPIEKLEEFKENIIDILKKRQQQN